MSVARALTRFWAAGPVFTRVPAVARAALDRELAAETVVGVPLCSPAAHQYDRASARAHAASCVDMHHRCIAELERAPCGHCRTHQLGADPAVV